MQLDRTIPARFLETAFRDDDLIAIAYRCLPHRESGSPPAADTTDRPPAPGWHHRFVTAARARAPRYLAWLRHLNASGNDIFVSMNTFGSPDGGRTEANVRSIRHIYADFDSGGDVALNALRARKDLPPLSYVVHSSREKFQAIWNVIEFEPAYAKLLLCHLAYALGADTAVHDTNRVLRLPGFFNQKYRPAPFIRLEIGDTRASYPPTAFPVPPKDAGAQSPSQRPRIPRLLPGTAKAVTRSEQDWAAVRSALAAGRPWHSVLQDLALERADKPNPRYYASLTVLNALNSLKREQPSELVTELQRSKRIQVSRGDRDGHVSKRRRRR